jgi:hypothetical protein
MIKVNLIFAFWKDYWRVYICLFNMKSLLSSSVIVECFSRKKGSILYLCLFCSQLGRILSVFPKRRAGGVWGEFVESLVGLFAGLCLQSYFFLVAFKLEGFWGVFYLVRRNLRIVVVFTIMKKVIFCLQSSLLRGQTSIVRIWLFYLSFSS